MAALKARAAPVEKWGRVPRAAMLLEKRLDALADYCDPMLLSEVDGFLAGIAVSPEPVAFEEWLPAILNLHPEQKVEAFLDPDDAKSFVDLLLKCFNTIVDEIAAGRYLPIIDVDTRNREMVWQLWIGGFARAMEFRPGSWDTFAVGSELTRNALKALRRLVAIDKGVGELPEDGFEVLTKLAPGLIPIWLGILMAWRLSGGASDYPEPLLSRLSAAVGRSGPCPCGSGRKFKKCCYGQ